MTWTFTLANTALGTFTACVAGLAAARLLSRRPVPFRYGLLLSALVLAVCAPAAALLAEHLGTARITVDPVAEPAPAPPALLEPARAGGSGEAVPAPLPATPIAWGPLIARSLAGLWIVGSVVAGVRLIRALRRTARLRRSLVPTRDPLLIDSARRAADTLGLRRPAPVCVSAAVATPLVMGPMRPTIVLPEDFADEFDAASLDAVMLHETAHIAHGDLWIGLLQSVAEAAFWWCVPLRWLNRRLAELREDICDNYVVRTRGGGFRLAKVLVELAARLQGAAMKTPAGALAMACPRADGLEGRVRRLLQKERCTMTRMNTAAAAVAGAFGTAVAALMMSAALRAAEADVGLVRVAAAPASIGDRLAAREFWSLDGAVVKHAFTDDEADEVRRLAANSKDPVIRIRAGKLAADLSRSVRFGAGWADAGRTPEQLVAAMMQYLEARRTDALVAKFAPEKGFTHILLTIRAGDDQPWMLIEDIRPGKLSSGLNVRWNTKSASVDRLEHWGVDRSEPAAAAVPAVAPLPVAAVAPPRVVRVDTEAELTALARRLAADNRPLAVRVDDLFRAAFGRGPNADELRAAMGHLQGKADEPVKAWEDCAWALANTREFTARQAPAPVDEGFARRVYIDIVGVEPTVDQLREAKGMSRQALVNRLMDESKAKTGAAAAAGDVAKAVEGKLRVELQVLGHDPKTGTWLLKCKVLFAGKELSAPQVIAQVGADARIEVAEGKGTPGVCINVKFGNPADKATLDVKVEQTIGGKATVFAEFEGRAVEAGKWIVIDGKPTSR